MQITFSKVGSPELTFLLENVRHFANKCLRPELKFSQNMRKLG